MATATKTQKVAKKKWFKIIAPVEFQNAIVGETLAYEAEQVLGRVVIANLYTLTKDMRKQSISLTLKVTDIKGADAHAEVTRYEMNPVHIKRLVRKSRSKIDDSFVAETNDKVKVRIKPLYLTKNITQRGVVTSIRMKSRDILTQELAKQSYSEFVSAVISGNIMKALKGELKKIYPLSVAEVRMFVKETK